MKDSEQDCERYFGVYCLYMIYPIDIEFYINYALNRLVLERCVVMNHIGGHYEYIVRGNIGYNVKGNVRDHVVKHARDHTRDNVLDHVKCHVRDNVRDSIGDAIINNVFTHPLFLEFIEKEDIKPPLLQTLLDV